MRKKLRHVNKDWIKAGLQDIYQSKDGEVYTSGGISGLKAT